MRILWLTNMVPGPVGQALTGEPGSGLWVDHVLEGLGLQKNISLKLLCPWESAVSGSLGEGCSYETFQREKPEILSASREELFRKQLQSFQPDVIHIWGTEFGHTLDMVRACEKENLLHRTVISIQGLCTYVGRHYVEGLPISVQKRYTLRDFLRRDNLLHQQRTFLKRGENEMEALKTVSHVIGRTHWDKACCRLANPGIHYHFCNETLRDSFYNSSWQYADCRKHRIFASSRLYPIKGFHYVLEAFREIRNRYPDAVLAVPGDSPCCAGSARLRQDSYARYLGELMKKYRLEDSVEYLGSLSEEEMKQQYLMANAFVMPSTIENSSNSLGEAMLLGVPCAAADVGGTATILQSGEGILYQGTAPYMLAAALDEIFSMGQGAEKMGQAASDHARITHDPETNLKALMKIYSELSGKEESL